MPLNSMTGFARSDGYDDTVSWVWEAKSVNGRGLDIRSRLPGGMDQVDAQARARITSRFSRGSINLNLQTQRKSGDTEYAVNRQLLEQLMDVAAEYVDRPGVEAARIDGLFSVRGVVEAREQENEDKSVTEDRFAKMLLDLDVVLQSLEISRQEEGARIGGVLNQQIDEIEELSKAARVSAAAQPEAIRARLAEQVAEILDAGLEADPDRIIQEAAVLAVKSDIREEIDRLDAHISAARDLLKQGGVVGRRLDFLAQEFNREANTLCSKAPDNELTQIGLDLKTVIDRLREQVQNIE
ncbi:MAG: YicC family protein [Alphaproteobacteria bacterium]|nr:YicC family protein [Alphaproteobacteria bacterium]MBT4086446.1 YicC family protein [Alphaproteobacteria bacterium]MBT4546426.1 YicC family protein [Alphaproteobacteria bacterium]MBT7747679.1 YicC family protein [Alphaproteobacteria bacterium]